MLATASETLNHENDCSNQSCKKFGLYEKYMYDHPMTLKFNYSLDEKPEFVIKNENDEPLFKLDKKHHGKIVDMNDNSIFNFRLEVMGASGVDLKLHTYLENDYLNKKIVTMTRFEKHYFQLIFSNTENEKMKLEL